jgi:hypothetical protein
MFTVPSASSKAWERKRDAVKAELETAIPEDSRKALADRASIPTIRYERYRKNGKTCIRRAAERERGRG